MRAQVAIEYLFIVGIVLVAISILTAIIWQQSEVATRTNQAQIAADSIAHAADSIYAQGPGAKTQINVYFPNGYEPSASSIGDRKIVINVFTPAGSTDALSITKANITGSLPTDNGYKVLTLEIIGGQVSVTSS